MDEDTARQLNGCEDEEAALKRALELSMAEDSHKRETSVFNIKSDGQEQDDAYDDASTESGDEPQEEEGDEREDTTTAANAANTTKDAEKTAAAAGGKVTGQGGNSLAGSAGSELAPPASTSTLKMATAMPSLLSLDRRAMEAERLARRQKQLEQSCPSAVRAAAGAPTGAQKPQSLPPQTKKRKASGNVVTVDDSSDPESGPGRGGEPPTRKRHRDGGVESQPNSIPAPALWRPVTILDGPPAKTAKTGDPPFANGVVKKTWARGQPRRGDDITIEEVLQKDDLQLAVLSSFIWDDEWIMAKIDLRKTRAIFVAYAPDEETKETMRGNVPEKRVRFCFPPMHSVGCMHSKLQILKFATYLRIVVPTGNLVPFDWGETGTMENMVFLIDLPYLDKAASTEKSPFLEDLSYFLAAQGLDQGLINSLEKYDFSSTKPYAFVHSICGSHTKNWKRTGYCGLGRAVSAMGWGTGDAVQVDYLCSSIGSLGDSIMNALYNACQGDSGMKELENRTSKSHKGKNEAVAKIASSDSAVKPRDCFRVYFPTKETVFRSRGGAPSAGTICFQPKWWNAPSFPREAFRNAQNVRDGVLLHTKLLFVRQPSRSGKDNESHGCSWVYLGSANLSESAWGRLVKERGTGKTKITCRNWECGVLIPSTQSPAQEISHTMENDNVVTQSEYMTIQESFSKTVPIPIVFPGEKYVSAAGGVLQPWFFTEDY